MVVARRERPNRLKRLSKSTAGMRVIPKLLEIARLPIHDAEGIAT
jgi:hypothetical protein